MFNHKKIQKDNAKNTKKIKNYVQYLERFPIIPKVLGRMHGVGAKRLV